METNDMMITVYEGTVKHELPFTEGETILAGHGDVNYPLLMGSPMKLTVSNGSYTLEWR